MRMTSKPATEADEQKALFRWLKLMEGHYPELQGCFHIPNGGSRHPYEAHNLRLEGVKAGVPDICLPVPRGGYHGVYIELKRVKGGRVSDEQRGWIEFLNRQGYLAVVCKGWEAARGIILNYLRAEREANHD